MSRGLGVPFGVTMDRQPAVGLFGAVRPVKIATIAAMAGKNPLNDEKYNYRHVHADLEAGKIIGNYGGNHVRLRSTELLAAQTFLSLQNDL